MRCWFLGHYPLLEMIGPNQKLANSFFHILMQLRLIQNNQFRILQRKILYIDIYTKELGKMSTKKALHMLRRLPRLSHANIEAFPNRRRHRNNTQRLTIMPTYRTRYVPIGFELEKQPLFLKFPVQKWAKERYEAVTSSVNKVILEINWYLNLFFLCSICILFVINLD